MHARSNRDHIAIIDLLFKNGSNKTSSRSVEKTFCLLKDSTKNKKLFVCRKTHKNRVFLFFLKGFVNEIMSFSYFILKISYAQEISL